MSQQSTKTPLDYVTQHLSEQHMMQLATVAGDQPWCCTVYFVADSEHNLYWASLPTRRHSREIAKHNKVAVAIPIAFVKGEKVIGLQFAGTAELLEPSADIRSIAEMYAQKFARDQQWIEDIVAGKTQHRFYKLTPHTVQLFDEVHFQDISPIKLL